MKTKPIDDDYYECDNDEAHSSRKRAFSLIGCMLCHIVTQSYFLISK
jgi:hypothetical protein